MLLRAYHSAMETSNRRKLCHSMYLFFTIDYKEIFGEEV